MNAPVSDELSVGNHIIADGIVAWKSYISLPVIFWLMLWFSINTGPWVFNDDPESLVELTNYIRATFPFFVALAALIYYLPRRHGGGIMSGPVLLWLIYGLIGLVATDMSPDPFDAAYWAFSYLSVFAAICAYLRTADNIDAIMQLNRLNWIVTTIFLLVLVFFARDVLLPVIIQQQSAYGAFGEVQIRPLEISMSRSSGMARFAAVPGVVAFAMLWHSQKLRKLLWMALFFGSAYLIYLMQSRGAIFGFLFAMAFVMTFQDKKSRIIGVVLVSLFGLMMLTDSIPIDTVNEIKDYIYRGQSEEDFRSMTGRTRAWENGYEVALESPIIGYGFQADRMLIHEHVHNTYLYALITSGFPGAAAFIAGLVWAWLLFIRIIRNGSPPDQSHKTFLIQAGGILAFFTVRSIPEVCGALFSVDFMVMLPVLAYLKIASDQIDKGDIK